MTQMRRTVKRRALIVGLIAAGALAGAASATDYKDVRGDTKPAPDIVGARVTNDQNDRITIRIQLTAPLGPRVGRIVGISVDADRDPTTGDAAGFDVSATLDGREASLARWKGGKLVAATRMKSSRITASGSSVTWVVDADELGVDRSFEFAVWTRYYRGAIELDGDEAPSGAAWVYELT
jgi:hypothetical protein